MNTPASSSTASSGSDVTSSPGPDTPKREYKFHAPVRKTYGRAKPAEQQRSSSPDPWFSQLSFSPSNSTNTSPVQQRRSRLSGSFGEPASSEAWMTPTRGTLKLIDELKRAKLDLDSDSDSSDSGEDKEEGSQQLDNVFKVRKASISTTPSRKRQQVDDEEEDVSGEDISDNAGSDRACEQTTPLRQRKRQLLDLDSSSPVRRSPRSVQGRDKVDLHDIKDILTPRSSSPSPPASPSRRSTRTSVVFPCLVTPASSASTTSTSSKPSISTVKSDAKKPAQQATISSFFATKAGTGTGILKGKAGLTNNQKPTGREATSTTTAGTEDSNQQVAKRTTSGPSAPHEAPKKLEQLFLAFSKDRTKSNATSVTSTTSKQRPITPARRPNQLQREDDKLKRYHCPQCGMPYVRGQPEDEQIHDRYHRAALGGIDYPGYKNEVVVARFRDQEVESCVASAGRNGGSAKGNSVSTSSSSSSSSSSLLWGEASSSRIVMVSMSDAGRASSVSAGSSNFEKKKVKEVLEVVNRELGSVEFDPEQLYSCKVFLYISGKKKVVGCVIAERIKEGFEIMTQTAGSGSGEALLEFKIGTATSTSTTLPSDSLLSGDSKSTERHVQVQQLDQDRGGAAIFCSKVPQPAICGINRIWVSSQHRRQKIASRMLDAVRERFIYACKLETKDMAFSQPTGDGKALARQYLGTDRFLVYVE
ncbi:N-acetyltransferase esco2 [Linnemannia hyalina]|uniref:N-acetyltransferase esco2 n=1 Tax=Linnemannia hyalina TaxID=64524 RepID=A0A9P8BPD2_9FUNG|nr:N-acetyltransferase esco2 [Linnemannia hyalina]